MSKHVTSSTAATVRRDRRRSSRAGEGLSRRRLTVYVTDDEMWRIETLADATNKSKSRVLIDSALRPGVSDLIDGVKLDAALETLKDLQQQIRGIAGNLNQLAHHANATQNFPVDAELIAKRVKALCLDIEDTLASVTR